jgi:membrane protein involved in colicin uptake
MSEQLTNLKNAAIEAESTVEGYKAEIAALESAETVDKDAVKTKKAELRKAESALKKANAAIVKEEGKAEKEAEKVAKAAAKEAEKAAKEAEKEAKAKAREEAKAAKAAEREANRMPEQNGIRRPKPDTKCGKTWSIFDEISQRTGQPASINEALEISRSKGMNDGNTRAEYARWRKFFGLSGRINRPKPE